MNERQLLDCLHESSAVHTDAPSAERRLSAAERAAWWAANRDRWRTERRLAMDDAVPRIGGVEDARVLGRGMGMPALRTGNERQGRKRARGNGR